MEESQRSAAPCGLQRRRLCLQPRLAVPLMLLLLLPLLLLLSLLACEAARPPASESLPFPVSTWARMELAADSPSEGPLAEGRCDHGAALDPSSGSIVLYGGFSRWEDGLPAENYLLDATRDVEVSWHQINDTGLTVPTLRYGMFFELRESLKTTQPTGERSWATASVLHSGMDFDEIELNDAWSWGVDVQQNVSSALTLDGYGDFTELDPDLSAIVPGATWGFATWLWTSPLDASHFLPYTDVMPPRDILLTFGGTSETSGMDTDATHLADFTNGPVPVWSVATTTGDKPPPMSGMRMVVIKGEMWVSFGYIATENGVTGAGGPDSYNRDLYVLGVNPHVPSTYMVWRVFRREDHEDQWPLWPMERAWHSMVEYKDRYLLIFGGQVIDGSSSSYWFNGMHLFDTVLMQWLPFPVRGELPHEMWSHTAHLVYGARYGLGDRMFITGGCTAGDYYMESIWSLRIGEGIVPANCTVSGPAIDFPVVANETTWFQIQTTDPSGAPIPWGTGLVFSVFVGGKDAATGIQGEIESSLVEVGMGLYNVTFTPAGGEVTGCDQLTSSVQITIKLDRELLPGAPFHTPLVPSRGGANTIFGADPSSPAQAAVNVAVRGHDSIFPLYPRDAFGNPLLLVDSSAPAGGASALEVLAHTARTGGLDVDRFSVLIDGRADSSVVLARTSSSDGSLRIAYRAPDRASFQMSVSYGGSPIAGSPFTITPLDNLDVSSPLNLAFIALGFIGLAALLGLLVLVIAKRNDPRIRASSPNFVIVIVLGAMIGMVSMLLPASPNIAWAGGMSTRSCQAYAWLLGLGFSTTFAALLAKTHRIARIFNSKQMRVVFLPDRELMKPVAAGIGLEVLFNLVWTLVNPLHVASEPSAGNPNVTLSVCTSDNLVVWQGITFVVKLALVVWAVKLTSSVRSAPGDFNEASALGAALSNIALCGVVLLPLVEFQALEQSPAALYLLKQIITLWCFLFTPAIIILPKMFESANSGNNTMMNNTQGNVMSNIGDEALSGDNNDVVKVSKVPASTLTKTPSSAMGGAGGTKRWAAPTAVAMATTSHQRRPTGGADQPANNKLPMPALRSSNPARASGGSLHSRLPSNGNGISPHASVQSSGDIALRSPSGMPLSSYPSTTGPGQGATSNRDTISVKRSSNSLRADDVVQLVSLPSDNTPEADGPGSSPSPDSVALRVLPKEAPVVRLHADNGDSR